MAINPSTFQNDRSIKLSVTVKSSLEHKYKPTALKNIEAAIEHWIASDLNRGIQTVHVAVDDTRDVNMTALGVAPVSGRITARKVKRAVDDLWKALNPEYLVLFGGHDVVPMFEVTNPEYDPDRPDEGHDKTLKTDSPYASSLPFLPDKRPSYIVPDRVIGRIPDMVSHKRFDGDPGWFVRYLATATNWSARTADFYTDTYAICAGQWKTAGEECMKYISRPASDLLISPRTSDGSSSAQQRLSARLHLIKCHGSPGEATFFGYPEQEPRTPMREDLFKPALTSATLKEHLRPATLVGTVCCYSAQIFSEPHKWPLASTYLRKGALAFVGSAGQTSNNADKMAWADRIVTDYLKSVLGGASIGRAFLDAKQLYLSRLIFGRHPYGLDQADEKTLIEYVLLGDPSIHPVSTESLPESELDAEDRRLRRLARQLSAWQVRKILPRRAHTTPAEKAMAEEVFTRARDRLPEDVKNELKEFGINPAEAKVEKRIMRLYVPKEAGLGPGVTESRHSLEYYWSARRSQDGRQQIRVIKAETDLNGKVYRTSVAYSS